MSSTKRVKLTQEFELLLQRAGVNDMIIKYGYLDYDQTYPASVRKGVFVESKVDVNTNPNVREMILVKYVGQSDMFGTFQSIEGDNEYGMLCDLMKAVQKHK